MTARHTGTEAEVEELTSTRSYKNKNFESKQTALMNLPAYYKGKKVRLDKLYNDVLGYSERMVICGRCDKKGIIRKKGDYYEIIHGRSDKKTCYLGKDLSEEFAFLPIRIINRES